MNWYLVAVLACPVGMGLMMWLMMRPGAMRMPGRGSPAAADVDAMAKEIARLRTQVEHLQAAQPVERVGSGTPRR